MSEGFGANSIKAPGPSISLVDNSRPNNESGVGNYKGVMLCNRPFGGTMATTKVITDSSVKQSFACGVVPEYVGQNVTISSKEKMKLFRSKKDTVLSKHRKWLSDLQKSREESEKQNAEEAMRKEEAQIKFTEQEKKLRQAAKASLHAVADDKESTSSSATLNQSQQIKQQQTEGEEHSETKAQQQSSNQLQDQREEAEKKEAETGSDAAADKKKQAAKKGACGGKKSKPAWAKAESKQDDIVVDEENELGDEADLLDFAESLDFNKDSGDVEEVKQMMERLRRRIEELEKDVAQEEAREADAEVRTKKRELLALMGETVDKLCKDEDGPRRRGDVMILAAKELLQGDEDMQAIHSQKSVVAMLRATREKHVAAADTAAGSSSGPGKNKNDGVVVKSSVANEPLIILHDPKEGAYLEAKNDVNKLPYMHRNPAV